MTDNNEGVSFEEMAGDEDTPVSPATVVSPVVATLVDDGAVAMDAMVDNSGPAYQFENPVFDSNDIAMPRLQLLQSVSQAVQERKGMAGQWLIRGYEPEDEVIVYPQAVAKTQELRNDEGIRVGFSPDGVRCCINPKARLATCPNAQWTEDDKGNRRPPKCQEVWRYIVVSKTHDLLAELVLQKTAIPTAKFINLQMRMKGPGKFALTLGHTAEKSKAPGRGSTTYYVPKATLNPNVDPEELSIAREAAIGSGGSSRPQAIAAGS